MVYRYAANYILGCNAYYEFGHVNIKSNGRFGPLILKKHCTAMKKKFHAMQSFVVYSTLVKLVLLLNLPINCPLITLAILYETPYSISSRFIGWRDVVSLIFCALSCLVSTELIPESHFLYNFTISMSWLWLIIDCLYENLQFIRQYPTHSSSHPNAARRGNCRTAK